MQHAARLARHLTGPYRASLAFAFPSPPPGFSPRLVHRRHLLTLAIETSCDDTCVAILETQDQCLTTRHVTRHTPPSEPAERGGPHAQDSTASPPPSRPVAKLHFDAKITAKNSGLGGIHPLEALSSHRANLAKLVDRALLSLPCAGAQGSSSTTTTTHSKCITCRDGSVRCKPDLVSVTRGPGMRSNSLVGLELAKGLAVGWQVPLVGVHHMQAHALTPRFVNAVEAVGSNAGREPEFPFLTLLVSGGHTMLLHSTGLTEHEILATTADVAIGDALDRTGWLLLPEDVKAGATDTAFGKYLSKYAFPDQASFAAWPVMRKRQYEIRKPVNEFGWQMQTPLSNTREMTFSFGSIESRVESIIKERENALQQSLPLEERLLLARTAIGSAFEHLGSRTVIALEYLKDKNMAIHNLVVSGGVAANDFLRHYLRTLLDVRGFDHVSLTFPPVKYCTDNAAMIGWTGIEMYEAGYSSDLSIDALRKWSMDADAADGGILGVSGWHHTEPT